MASETHSFCRIELFGPLRLIRQERVTTRFKLQKAATLLGYLALHPHRAQTRERLVDLLWPELDLDAGRNNLSTTLSALRRELEPSDMTAATPKQAILLADRQSISLNRDCIATDVAEFDGLLKQARSAPVVAVRSSLLERAVTLYQGDLLEGCYEEWAVTAQTAYRERFREALLNWAQDLETQQEWKAAQRAAERAMQADPLQEDAILLLMRTLARQGNVVRALDTFRQFQQRLREEMDAEPTTELRQMVDRLQRDPDALLLSRPALQPSGPTMAAREEPKPLTAQPLSDAALPAPRTNLPQWLTPLIGRQREMTEIARLFAANRLLTLTGIGGGGKTRLALQTGHEALPHFPDGVWLVELAALSDPALVANAVAHVLGVAEQPGQTVTQTLVAALQSRCLLLVLDNCEHLLAACAHLASHLLRACPHLSLLATSREALVIAGEQTYRVPSLALPDSQQRIPVETLSRYGAIQLFVERAQLVRSGFAVTEQNVTALVSVCQRLDGISLAIELAAARSRSLSVEELNRRLDDRFGLLVGGDRAALPRQQTLRALLDWSYDLLTDNEKTLLGCLSVFVPSWTLEAAEKVTGEGTETLNLLTSLVDKSLVLVEEPGRTLRYRMLETVRQYAAERLHDLSETEKMRSRHRDWCVDFVEAGTKHLKTYETQWMDCLETEHANLRVALDWCALEPEGAEPGLRLAGALPRFWDVRGHLAEGRECLERALACADAQPKTMLRVKVLNGLSNLALSQGDYATAQTCMEEGLSISKEFQDTWNISLCLGNLGNLAVTKGDYTAAQAFYEEGLVLSRKLEDAEGIGYALHGLSDVAYYQGDFVTAQVLCEEGLQIRRAIQDRRGVAFTLGGLGNILQAQGDTVGAIRCFTEGLAAYKELGEMWGTADALLGLADVCADMGRMRSAIALCATAATLRESIGAPLSPALRERDDRLRTRLKEALGEDAFTAAWNEGDALTWEQAVTGAWKETSEPSAA